MNDRDILKVILVSLYKDKGRLERGWNRKEMPETVKNELMKINICIAWTEEMIETINQYEERMKHENIH